MPKYKIPSQAELRRKHPSSNSADIILPEDGIIRLPSRILPFNYQIGGGIPYGRILELMGWESTGKSLLASDFAYCTQYLGGQVLWGDLENAWSNSWAKECGLDTSAIELLDGDNAIEHFSDWSKDMILYYRSKLTNNEPILLVCDSIAAGETLQNLDTDQTDAKAEMGSRAKAWDKMYRSRIAMYKKLGVCVIMVNQLRGKIGATMFEAAETTPGGKSAAFYASIRVALVKGKQLKGRITRDGYRNDLQKGKKFGNNVTIQVKKNKTHPPADSVKTEVYFSKVKTDYVGYNKYLGLDSLALDQGVITKEGNTYSVKGKKIAGKRDDVLLAIQEKGKLRKYIVNKLGINTLSQVEDQISSIDKNLFKVES